MPAHNTHTHDNRQDVHTEAHLAGTYTSVHNDEMNGKTFQQIVIEILRLKRWAQGDLANHIKVSQPTVSRWLDPQKPSSPQLEQRDAILALARGLNVIDRTYQPEQAVPIVGYVGAGGQIAFSEGQGPFGEADMPPDKSPSTVAVKVQGTSMSPMAEDGWLVYYDQRQEEPSESLYGKPCVVGLADGRILIKKLTPGSGRGLYHLISINGDPLLDQAVEWAARITFLAPSK